jgi:hypothetical protein|tara:strand:+ start:910 stop:1581 length:672 start_codon:yes stop_codon:yes gene_type:complete
MEITIKIPENLREITLGQYQKYLKMEKENKDETFIAQKMIEIFCQTRLDYVMKMRWKDVQDITVDLANMFEADQNLKKQFTMNSTTYGFIPNLDEISFGEFVDLDGCLQDWQEMHKAMQILYRPVEISVRGKYNIKQYDGVLDDSMKDMPLEYALGAVFFLLSLGKELSAIMMDYLQRGVLKEHTLLKQGLAENGVGIHHFTKQLKEMLQDLNISQNLGYTKS